MIEEYKTSPVTPLFPSAPYVDAVDLLEKPYEQPTFLVRHLIPTASIVLLTGDSGAGKTAFALHLAAAIAADDRVASRFRVEKCGARVLYCNGEMGSRDLVRFLKQAASGLGRQVVRDRLFFEGVDAIATAIRGSDEARLRFEELVDVLRPDLIIIDTQRAILIEDENSGVEVRRAFSWLRSAIVNPFGASVLVAHHLRKVGQISNSDRERVSGSRDLIAAVDLHVAAKAVSGQPMNALSLGKTRTPIDDVRAGTTWPIECRLEPGRPAKSVFIAGDPASAESTASAEESAATEIRARLGAEGGLTLEQLKVGGGVRKRAWERLRKNGEVSEVGKRGRKTLYGLATDDHESLFDEDPE